MMKTLSSGNCTLNVPAKNSYRMVVLGASRVGKSSIVSRFLNGRFEDQYTPTIEDFHRKVYNIHGDMYQLDILDTSGNHPFPAMRRLSILTGDVFILVFSLDSRESFDEVKRLQKQILEVKSCLKNKTKEAAELPMVICGNKNDHSELCRQVPAMEAELLVSGDENCAYFEVSAKKNTNVNEMFYVLFSMAKLPHEMSPALHHKISVQYGDAFHPRPFCMRRTKVAGAYGMVSPFARRPSVNSDLKYIKAKVLREGQARERDKCSIHLISTAAGPFEMTLDKDTCCQAFNLSLVPGFHVVEGEKSSIDLHTSIMAQVTPCKLGRPWAFHTHHVIPCLLGAPSSRDLDHVTYAFLRAITEAICGYCAHCHPCSAHQAQPRLHTQTCCSAQLLQHLLLSYNDSSPSPEYTRYLSRQVYGLVHLVKLYCLDLCVHYQLKLVC